MKYRIYVADDEKNIRDLLKEFLEKDGYNVTVFPDGETLFEEFKARPCDLVILDIMMPGKDGLEICNELRKITAIPIIMLTAKDSEMDYIRGISTGSDDYIMKPFKPSILLMKIHALLRRVEMDRKNHHYCQKKRCSYGDLTYDEMKNTIFCDGVEISFTKTELRLIFYMISHFEKSFSKEELLNEVWGYDSEVETRVIDETLRKIRKKLSEVQSIVHIQTIWAYGYKLTKLEEA